MAGWGVQSAFVLSPSLHSQGLRLCGRLPGPEDSGERTRPGPGSVRLGAPEPHSGRGPCVSPQSIIFDEVDLTDASVAESSTKNVNNSFTVRLWAHAFRGSSPCLGFLFNLNKRVSSSDFFVLFALMEVIPGRF